MGSVVRRLVMYLVEAVQPSIPSFVVAEALGLSSLADLLELRLGQSSYLSEHIDSLLQSMLTPRCPGSRVQRPSPPMHEISLFPP